MKLLINLIIVLLVCTALKADNIADESSSMSNETLQFKIKKFDEIIKQKEANIKLLDKKISDIDKQIKTNNEMRHINNNTYLPDILRSALLTQYPTLCLPEGRVNQTHNIHLREGSLQVACDGEIAGPGWIIIHRRDIDNWRFNRRSFEYENGFGNITGSYFIGLKQLHQLTSLMPHELYIHLESLSGQTRYANYDHFEIADIFDSYYLKSLGNYQGTAGDSFYKSLRNKFSYKYGWWISAHQSGIQSTLNDAYSQWRSLPEGFKTVQMMIRPTMKAALCKCLPKQKCLWKKPSWFP